MGSRPRATGVHIGPEIDDYSTYKLLLTGTTFSNHSMPQQAFVTRLSNLARSAFFSIVRAETTAQPSTTDDLLVQDQRLPK